MNTLPSPSQLPPPSPSSSSHSTFAPSGPSRVPTAIEVIFTEFFDRADASVRSCLDSTQDSGQFEFYYRDSHYEAEMREASTLLDWAMAEWEYGVVTRIITSDRSICKIFLKRSLRRCSLIGRLTRTPFFCLLPLSLHRHSIGKCLRNIDIMELDTATRLLSHNPSDQDIVSRAEVMLDSSNSASAAYFASMHVFSTCMDASAMTALHSVPLVQVEERDGSD